MDNKELPQEIVIKMREFIQSEMAHKCTAIAQTYYNSIIEGKDKEIVEKNSHIANLLTEKVANIFMIAHQKAEIGELEAAHEKSEHTLWLTVMAKDGEIGELKKMLNLNYGGGFTEEDIKIAHLNAKVTEQQAEIERITELLKAEYFKRLSHLDHPRQTLENLWSFYKKEHNL